MGIDCLHFIVSFIFVALTINFAKCPLLYSVLDVNASDLPGGIKHSLKSLAHDLAGSMIFDYGQFSC